MGWEHSYTICDAGRRRQHLSENPQIMAPPGLGSLGDWPGFNDEMR